MKDGLGSKLLKKSRRINGVEEWEVSESNLSSCDNFSDEPVKTRIGEVEDEKRR